MTVKDDLRDVLDDDDGGLYEAVTEINVLAAPSAEHCQWGQRLLGASHAQRLPIQPVLAAGHHWWRRSALVRAARTRNGVPTRRVGSLMTVRDDLHHLIDELDEDAAREALAYLKTLGLPAFLRDAPLDDEPVTNEERAAVAEAEAAIARGDVVRDEDLKS